MVRLLEERLSDKDGRRQEYSGIINTQSRAGETAQCNNGNRDKGEGKEGSGQHLHNRTRYKTQNDTISSQQLQNKT